MRLNVACVNALTAVLIALLATSVVSAQTTVIPHTTRGSYVEIASSYIPNASSYDAGDYRVVPCGRCRNDVRNFFIFDLAGLTQPIISATLELYVPAPSQNGPGGYTSADPSENYELHDIVTPLTVLLNGTGGEEGTVAWNDMGTGVVYGSRTMTANDLGTTIEIPLNASAIAALDAATGLIGLGGSITTLDDLPNNEYVFAFGGGLGVSQLRITYVPEPSTVALFGMSALSLCRYRKSRSRH